MARTYYGVSDKRAADLVSKSRKQVFMTPAYMEIWIRVYKYDLIDMISETGLAYDVDIRPDGVYVTCNPY